MKGVPEGSLVWLVSKGDLVWMDLVDRKGTRGREGPRASVYRDQRDPAVFQVSSDNFANEEWSNFIIYLNVVTHI